MTHLDINPVRSNLPFYLRAPRLKPVFRLGRYPNLTMPLVRDHPGNQLRSLCFTHRSERGEAKAL